jgi:hypothetical protein
MSLSKIDGSIIKSHRPYRAIRKDEEVGNKLELSYRCHNNHNAFLMFSSVLFDVRQNCEE